MPKVIGAIRDKWIALGGEKGFGTPLDDERPTPDGVGRFQDFQGGGTISWRPDIGAFAVWGDIRKRWDEIGRERAGYPITDETGAADGTGRFNHFRDSDQHDWSIYWTPRTGAHEVYGAIRDYWAQQGWEGGSLGYPVDIEHDAPSGGGRREQNFERGRISWTADTGASTLPAEEVHPTISLADWRNEVAVSGKGFTRSNRVLIAYGYTVDGEDGVKSHAFAEIIAPTDVNGHLVETRFDLNSVRAKGIGVRAKDIAREVYAEASLRDA